MKSKKPTPRALALATILSATLTACATTTDSAATSSWWEWLTGADAESELGRASFCAVAKPIYWSALDTGETIAQVKEHNAVGAALCGWGKVSTPPSS